MQINNDGTWNKPPLGFCKLNVDGGFIDGVGFYGGILRDSNGEWIWGYYCKDRAVGPENVEWMAMFNGLKNLIDNNIGRVIIKTDCVQVANGCLEYPAEDNPIKDIILKVKTLRRQLWEAPIFKVSRNKNEVADTMCKMAREKSSFGFRFFEGCPGRLDGSAQ